MPEKLKPTEFEGAFMPMGAALGIKGGSRRPRSFVGRIDAGERRIDVIEFIEIVRVLQGGPKELFGKLVD